MQITEPYESAIKPIGNPECRLVLVRFALMCGVRSSFKSTVAGKASQLFGEASPDHIIHDLGEALDLSMLGQVSIHLYSYGGLVRTASWAKDFQERQLFREHSPIEDR